MDDAAATSDECVSIVVCRSNIFVGWLWIVVATEVGETLGEVTGTRAAKGALTFDGGVL